jgi:nucleotide-binding universal stress UspA family protein
MTELSIREPPLILVPVEVLEGQTVPEKLATFLAPSDVVVLGYHVLPDQTPAEQASLQFEDRAQEAVEDIAAVFHEAGRDVQTRVAFTHDRDQTVERVAAEVGATAIALPNPTGDIEEVLVPLRGFVDVNRLADLVSTLLADTDGRVTVWGLAANESDFDASNAVQDALETLRSRGLPDEQVAAETDVVESPVRKIVERSADFDAIVMGEGGDSLLAALFGEEATRVAEGAVAPVLVVQSRPAGED